MRLFERMVAMSQSAYLTATYCGVGIVLVSMACILAIWLPTEGEMPDQPPEATPSQRPPATPSPSSGAPQN